MNGITKMLYDLHKCLHEQFQPGAFEWVDTNFNQSWSRSVDRLDTSMAKAVHKKDWDLFRSELDLYKSRVLNMFEKYKSHHKEIAAKNYLKLLKEDLDQGLRPVRESNS